MSTTTNLIQAKILKILTLLFLVRLALYIPVPNVDLEIFSQGQTSNPMFGFARTLTGSSFLGIGSLGILPYINASILIQLITPLFPNLERLQKEEGELGRQKLNRYTRYLTFVWAVFLSISVAIFLVKPLVFNWNLASCFKIVLSLTTGSLLSMWFAELITEEKLGNGSSMIIFINVIGGISSNFNEFIEKLNEFSYKSNLILGLQGLLIYVFVVFIVVVFQDAYKKIDIVSAKQLNVSYLDQIEQSVGLKSSYIPIKLNQGGIMPLIFSSTIATLFYYPVQIFASTTVGQSLPFLANILPVYSVGINIILVVFFSCFYAVLVLKPNDISQNLAKMAYTIPGIRQGVQTTIYLEQVVGRLAFMGGLFLAFLAFFPLLLGLIFKFNIFRNVTSLLILIGVITDTTAQIRGYLISRNYEGFKNA